MAEAEAAPDAALGNIQARDRAYLLICHAVVPRRMADLLKAGATADEAAARDSLRPQLQLLQELPTDILVGLAALAPDQALDTVTGLRALTWLERAQSMVELARLRVCRALWACLAGGQYTERWRLQSDRPLPALVYLGGACVLAHAAHSSSMGCDMEGVQVTLLVVCVTLVLFVVLVRNPERDSWGPVGNLDSLLPQLILEERTRLAVRP